MAKASEEKKAAVPAKKRVLDFTNVKERGLYNPVQQEEGDYRATITTCMEQDSSKGDAMWVFGLKLDGSKTAVYPYYCVLNEEQLWKVRNLIEATGKKVPKKRLAFEPQSIVGKDVGISLQDDEYDGKMKSVIQNIFPASELDDDSAPADDTDDDDIEDEEVEDELDDDEDEEEEEPEPPKKKKKAATPAKKAPVKKAPAKKKKAAPVEDDDDEDVDDDELDELDVEDL